VSGSRHLSLLLTTVGLATGLAAQDRIEIHANARVRVTSDAGRIVGHWGGRVNDSITILDPRTQTTRVLPVHTVRVFELSRGRVSRTGRGAFLGLVSGTGAGLASALALCLGGRCSSSGGDFGGLAALAFAGLGAVGGTAIGALIGSQIRSEQWTRAPLRGMRVSLVSPGPVGLHLGVRVSWALSTRHPR
jgi:hypothetical protein